METDTLCKHYWRLESPDGPFSLGQCKRCKKYGAFKNSGNPHTWFTKTEEGVKYDSEEEALQAFLQEKLSNIEKTTTQEETLIPRTKRTTWTGLKVEKQSITTWDTLKQDYDTINTTYTLEFKATVVMAAKNYQNIKKAASEFKVPRRTLRGWIKKNDTMDN